MDTVCCWSQRTSGSIENILVTKKKKHQVILWCHLASLQLQSHFPGPCSSIDVCSHCYYPVLGIWLPSAHLSHFAITQLDTRLLSLHGQIVNVCLYILFSSFSEPEPVLLLAPLLFPVHYCLLLFASSNSNFPCCLLYPKATT